VQEWDDEDDGTMEGSLGYGNILESPPAAYLHLQARLLARRQKSRDQSPVSHHHQLR